MTVKRTERGWGAHLCVADSCRFRRNTLLELENVRVVVSTVGAYFYREQYQEIGYKRHFETCAFQAVWDDPYWDADVTKEISLDSNWSIEGVKRGSDKLANQMHEDVVVEIMQKMIDGTLSVKV